MLIYRQLVPWYPLLDPHEDHLAEATCYREALERAVTPPRETLLDLGGGAGRNAFHLKERFRCTLVDLSEEMLSLSRELNPECEHIAGDMRTVRLHRQFDAVLVHDAIMYMTTEADLRAALETAFIHTRPGGAAIITPDYTRETFADETDFIEADNGGKSMRCIEWSWDPDPTDSTFRTEYSFLLRDETGVQAIHDSHVEGLFSREIWLELLSAAGYRTELIARPIDEEGNFDEIFLCRRP